MSNPVKFECVIPILSVKNVPASIDYYLQKLGFEKKWDWPSDQTHKTFACVARGNIEIFLCQGEQGNPGTWLFISVGNVDALHQEYIQRGAVIRQKPTNFSWGEREMNVQDIDGHRLRFGSPATGPSDGTPLAEE